MRIQSVHFKNRHQVLKGREHRQHCKNKVIRIGSSSIALIIQKLVTSLPHGSTVRIISARLEISRRRKYLKNTGFLPIVYGNCPFPYTTDTRFKNRPPIRIKSRIPNGMEIMEGTIKRIFHSRYLLDFYGTARSKNRPYQFGSNTYTSVPRVFGSTGGGQFDRSFVLAFVSDTPFPRFHDGRGSRY